MWKPGNEKLSGNAPRRIALICSLLLAPFWASAQTLPEGHPVALMTFLGDDLDISALFQTHVVREVGNLGRFSIQLVGAAQYPESLRLSPDQPPAPAYLGDSRQVLTGEYYIDMDDLQHFQLWLWNSASGSLVYTDEMVFEEMEEAESYLPPMVNWIFSHIPTEDRLIVVETGVRTQTEPNAGNEEEETAEKYKPRFYLGLWGGGFLSTTIPQTSGDYEGGVSQGFTGEAAVVVEFRPLQFLSLQAEGIFVYDTFKAAKETQKTIGISRSIDTFWAMSLMIPLLVKVPLEIERFTLAPFMGVYYIVPLGAMNIIPNASDERAASYKYTIGPSFGLTLGIDVGFSLGKGELFGGLRFDRDLGLTSVTNTSRMEYTRHRLGLFVGYKFRVGG
jgi:hypothetical protein